MRKILGLLCLFVMMVGTSMAEEIVAPPPPGPPIATCDGTTALKDKCNKGSIPMDCIESEECQAVVTGLVVCKNALAFAQDDFYCTAPEADKNSTPPTYTSYCVDRNTVVNCTIRKNCNGTTFKGNDGKQYTDCKADPFGETSTWRYKKMTRSFGADPKGCEAILKTP